MNFVNVGNKKAKQEKQVLLVLRRSNDLARAQNTDVQNECVLCSRCLSRYSHDKGNITTTIQSRTNEQKNDIIVLSFSHVGNHLQA